MLYAPYISLLRYQFCAGCTDILSLSMTHRPKPVRLWINRALWPFSIERLHLCGFRFRRFAPLD